MSGTQAINVVAARQRGRSEHETGCERAGDANARKSFEDDARVVAVGRASAVAALVAGANVEAADVHDCERERAEHGRVWRGAADGDCHEFRTQLIIVYESVENGGDGGGGDGQRATSARGSDGAVVGSYGTKRSSTTLHMLPYYFARHAHRKNDSI